MVHSSRAPGNGHAASTGHCRTVSVMTDQPPPIRPLKASFPLTEAHVVRFRDTSEINVLQTITQWCVQNGGAITILGMNWSYKTPNKPASQVGPDDHDEVAVDVVYEAVDLALLDKLRRGEVVLRAGQLVDQAGNKVT